MSGCASSWGVREVAQTYWREDMGRLNQATLDAGLQKILEKHALRLDRRERSNQGIHYESNWIERSVQAEEHVRGVRNARNRFVIRGQALEFEWDARNVYRITWELQNEVTTTIGRGWHPATLPESVKEDFRRIYADLFMEVRTGVKR